jgi:hypothetical protein
MSWEVKDLDLALRLPERTLLAWLGILGRNGFVWQQVGSANDRTTRVGLTDKARGLMLQYFAEEPARVR